MPTTGRWRRHLSLGGPATAVTPDPGEVSRRSHGPDTRAWGLRRTLSAGPEPCAELRGRGPPSPSARRLRPAGPIASGRSPQTPNPGRTEQHSRAATTTSGAPERTSARRARPLRTHRASGPPARPSFPSSPAAAAAPAAPWAAALGVGTGLGQGAEVGSRPTGVA